MLPFLTSLIAPGLLTSVAHAEVVDGILHVVGDRIVTQSDVAFEAAFGTVDVSPLGPLRDPEYPIEQRLIDFAILRHLAGDIEIYKPSAAEVRARWDRFRQASPHLDDHARFLALWGVDADQLLGFLYSRLVVERYIARNALPSAAAHTVDGGLSTATYQAWMAGLRQHVSVRTPE